MRALSVLLALMLWLTPAFQVFAGTMAQAHCRTHGHIGATAPDAGRDATHAAHHDGHEAMNHEEASAPSADGAHCKCGCLCDLACAGSLALAPSFIFLDAPESEHFRQVSSAMHPYAEHSVPQRPPAVLS